MTRLPARGTTMGSYSPSGPHGGTIRTKFIPIRPLPAFPPRGTTLHPGRLRPRRPAARMAEAVRPAQAMRARRHYQAGWFVSGIIVAFLWTFWVALFPAAVAAAAAGMYGSWTLHQVPASRAWRRRESSRRNACFRRRSSRLDPWSAALEHVLACFLAYRLLRHCLRLLTFGWLFLRYIPEQVGDAIFPSQGLFDLSVLSTTSSLAITAWFLGGCRPSGCVGRTFPRLRFFWSGRRESNSQPTAWKAVTLPLSYSRL
jgi:hypothetical protein